jgi:hypothetical protein
MTIGASNTTGFSRFLGTSLGALAALLAWFAAHGNAIGLAIIGWLMSLWTAYLILVKGSGPMGRFIMLTYNLVVLYAYSLSQNDGTGDQDEGGDTPVVAEIALHRLTAVISGIIWGIVITRVVWPISARRSLKDGLSSLWLRLSVLWTRDPLSSLSGSTTSLPYLTTAESLHMQRSLLSLEALRVSSLSEFSLKQPFPDCNYKVILSRTQRILDALQAINLAIMKNPVTSEGQVAWLEHTCAERRELSSRVAHLFFSMLDATIPFVSEILLVSHIPLTNYY